MFCGLDISVDSNLGETFDRSRNILLFLSDGVVGRQDRLGVLTALLSTSGGLVCIGPTLLRIFLNLPLSSIKYSTS